jgi:hypothetical protein
MAGPAFGRIIAVSGRFDGNWIVKLPDVQVAFEGKGGPLGNTREGTRCLGHDQTLATGQWAVFPSVFGRRERRTPEVIESATNNNLRYGSCVAST